MAKQWMNWCRLCGQEDFSNTNVNVFIEDEKGLPLTDTINKCFSIDINRFNNWPKTICVHCFSIAKSIIELARTTSKVHAMFAELLDAIDDIDANKVKLRHGLPTISDIKFDIKVPIANTTVNAFEFTEINEQMVDLGEIKYIESDLLNTNIKTEDTDEDYVDQSDQIDALHEQYSHEDVSSESDSDYMKQKTKKNRKKKYKLKKEKKAKSKTNKKEPYRCSDCDKGFIKLEGYRQHMQSTHAVTIETKAPLLVCETCGKVYKSHSGLYEHKFTHSEVRKHKCKYCDKTFKGLPSKKRHEDTHNDTKYICVVCGLQLNTQRTLGQHMIVHSDKKNYKCEFCGNEYKRAKALKYHLITHAGLRPYCCEFCEKTFTNAANCRIHKRRHHPVAFAEQEATGKNKKLAVMPKLMDLKALINGKQNKNNLKTIEPMADVVSISANNSEVGPNYSPKHVDNEFVTHEQATSKTIDFFYN